jgi:2-methylcitrate dehydratase PrpD
MHCHADRRRGSNADSQMARPVCRADSTPWCEPIAQRRRPDNTAAATDSIPFCVAIALERGHVTLADITGQGLRSPLVLGLAQRTVSRIDDRAGAAAVAVTRRNGERSEARVALTLEGAATAIADEQIFQKFADCCNHASAYLTKTDIERIATTTSVLEKLDGIGRLAAPVGGRRGR